MTSVKAEIEQELDHLRALTSSDFSAIAWRDDHDNRIRWKYVSGNQNERYHSIALKPGRGLAGLVIRLGRTIVVDEASVHLDRLRQEYSIMLVEQLQMAVAFPMMINNETSGVLLIGNRSKGLYPQQDAALIEKSINLLNPLIHLVKFSDVLK
ncbi:GAF domain-containing protein [Paenibacillus eucommiae]|uniref:Nitrogen regulatory protein A n=1 Tax=Paenibacillus eucommiae TaxID=1355755 RepID=A0ABS4IUX0_9BACL|nr:GAF domain-containing protein [Paenibacillus eucommiae]MBP1990781.1 nitrogen regulatory protein A [Paenibacillus eucommiae]